MSRDAEHLLSVAELVDIAGDPKLAFDIRNQTKTVDVNSLPEGDRVEFVANLVRAVSGLTLLNERATKRFVDSEFEIIIQKGRDAVRLQILECNKDGVLVQINMQLFRTADSSPFETLKTVLGTRSIP